MWQEGTRRGCTCRCVRDCTWCHASFHLITCFALKQQQEEECNAQELVQHLHARLTWDLPYLWSPVSCEIHIICEPASQVFSDTWFDTSFAQDCLTSLFYKSSNQSFVCYLAALVVDRPTRLICISDIYLSTYLSTSEYKRHRMAICYCPSRSYYPWPVSQKINGAFEFDNRGLF